MDRKVRLLLCAVLTCLAVTAIGWSQTTYKDPQGRFVIDLPKGWKYDPMMPAIQNDKTADFQDEGKKNAFTLAISRGFDDPDKLIQHAALQFKFLEPVFDGDIMAMTVNGHPSRWGVLKTPLDPGMVMQVASIVLEDNGIYLIHTLRTEKRESVGKLVEQAFHSLRLPGEEVTGVEGVKAVAGAATPTPVAEPTPWKSKLVSLTLPPGWTETPKPRGSEKEVQGIFANDSLPGVTLIAVGYKGMGMSMPKALDAGIKTFTIPVPGAQPIDVQETEIEGKKINLVVYKGTSVGSGTEVELGAVIVVMKADKCYLNLIAIGQATVIAEMKAQVLEIVKTVK